MAEKQCPWCAETIRAEALKCRHCGSRLQGGPDRPDGWHRDYPERKMAGVCAAIARNLDVPVLAVRVVFALLTFYSLAGVIGYGVLWFLLPSRPGEETGLDRALDVWHSTTDGLLGSGRSDDDLEPPRERPPIRERPPPREDPLDSD